MKNLKLFLASFFLVCSAQAYAKKKTATVPPRVLIKQVQNRMNARKLKIADTKLLKFMISPAAPKVTEDISAFIQPLTGFTDSEILLQISLDGQSIANAEHPATELWVADFGSFSESKSHTVSVKIFLRDKNAAKLITDAIVVLDGEIADLNTQIAEALDPEVIAQLTAQRDDKVAQRSELIATLASLQSQIGEESHEFFVQENIAAPGYPKIFDITPNVVKSGVEKNISVAGENFDGLSAVKIDGVLTTVFSSQSDAFQATLPPLTPGAHTLEVQTSVNGVIKNTIQKNAIFASSNDLLKPDMPPVAVVSVASSPVLLGGTASFSAASSYDPYGGSLSYEWKYLSVPPNSGLVTGVVVGSAVNFNFVPAVPGSYVLQQVVGQDSGPELTSAPVFVVVEVSAPANRIPLLDAPAISVLANQTTTSLVSTADLDFWQQHQLIIGRQTNLGTATLANGVVTFVAGSQAGSDYITVLRIDNGSPPLVGSVTIPVTVASSNQAPVISNFTSVISTENLPVGMRFYASYSDPDGASDLASIKLETGDGITEYFATSGPNFGAIAHNYHAYGTYTATLTVTDRFGASTSQNFTVNANQTDVPTAKFQLSSFSCSIPCTISTDASTSSDQQGISSYLWDWGDGSPEVNGGVNPSHTYSTAGTYAVRLRTRDSQGAEGEGYALFYAGVTAPANGTSTYGVSVASPSREVLINAPITLNGSSSFDPMTGGNVSSYSWRRNGGCNVNGANCVATGPSATFSYNFAANFFPRLTTTNILGRSTVHTNTEIFAVTAGHAPKALFAINRIVRPTTIEGQAPFLAILDSSLSYDYEGPIASRFWDFGDLTEGYGVVETKVYANPGVYFISLYVLDSDNNEPGRSQMVIVNPAGKKAAKQFKTRNSAAEDEEQYLVQTCGKGDGESCYALANIYLAQGNTFVYERLMQKACALSYQPACSKKNRGIK